jgi:hypothetical protein
MLHFGVDLKVVQEGYRQGLQVHELGGEEITGQDVVLGRVLSIVAQFADKQV